MALYSQLFLRNTTSPYGDFTRNSVLSFKDLDQNFIFLKERDISNISYSSDTLTIDTLGGNSFTTTISGGTTSLWSSNVNGIHYNSGNVGIGMSASSVNTKLEINYSGSIETAFRIKNIEDNSQFNLSTNLVGGKNLFRINSDNSGLTPLVVSNDNRVGIGSGLQTITPQATLHIYSTSNSQPIVLVEDESNPDATPFIIDIDGNVGIGTDTPQVELHIKGDSSILRLETTSPTNDNYVEFWDPTERKGFLGYVSTANIDALFIRNEEHDADIIISTTNSGGTSLTAINIDGNQDVGIPNGNVGIGLSTPDSKLHVEGTTGKLKVRLDNENLNETNQLLLTSEDSTYTNFLSIGSTTLNAELQFGMVGPSSTSKVVGDVNDSFITATSAADNMNFINNAGVGTTDNIGFYAGKTLGTDLSATTSDIMILGDGADRGYIGIGTDTPTEKLDISGNTKISGILNIGTLGTGTSVNNLGIDSSGNVVTGKTGPDSITFEIFNTSPTSPDPYTIYDDGNIRLLFDEAATDDIEIVVLTNPSTGPVHVVWSEPTAGTSGSANVTTASGQVPLNTEVSADDIVDFVIWAPEDSTYPYYEAKVTVSNGTFTSIPAVARVSKWNSPS